MQCTNSASQRHKRQKARQRSQCLVGDDAANLPSLSRFVTNAKVVSAEDTDEDEANEPRAAEKGTADTDEANDARKANNARVRRALSILPVNGQFGVL